MRHSDRISFLLDKLRRKNCTPAELEELKAFFSEEDGNAFRQFLDEELEIQSGNVSSEKREKLWHAISENIKEIPLKRTPFLQSSILRWMAAAAAVCLLVIAGRYFWASGTQPEQLQTVQVGKVDTAQLLLLPDGSKVWLNANSRLTYPVQFLNKKRSVTLQGHAYFEVVKDESKPFEVQSGQLTTTVLGTTFDVLAFPDSGRVEVSLFTGKVWVKHKQHREKWVLEPMQRLDFDLAKETGAIHAFNPDLQAAWRTGEMKFVETRMAEVVTALKMLYPGCTIDFSDRRLSEIQISGTFKTSEKLENILELLCFNKGWTVQTTGNNNHFIIKE